MRKGLYAALAVIILAVIGYSLSGLLGGSSSQPVGTATPSTSTSPTTSLGGKTLRSYLGTPTLSIAISSDAAAADDFRNGIITAQPTAKQAQILSLTSAGSTYTSTSFLAHVIGAIPPALTSVLGSDWAVLAYGQSETYDTVGAKTEAQTARPRTVFIAEITDASAGNQAMQQWEGTGLASSSEKLLQTSTAKKLVSSFSEGVYRTIPVRYWNFPYADSSVDYAIVTASNNKNYLIISASRESIFFIIDQLMK